MTMNFYIYLSSADSKHLYNNNTFSDFTVELWRPHSFEEGEWLFALTDIYLETKTRKRQIALAESVIILSDLAKSSYIREQGAPVLRYIPATDDVGSSLFQPHYVGLSKTRVSRIRVYLKDQNLKPIDSSKWEKDLTLKCTLHFMKA